MAGRTELSISVGDLIDGRVRFTLAGEIDDTNADVLDTQITLATTSSTEPLDEIALDVTDVRFIDSRGLGVLLRQRRNLDASTAIVLEGPSEHFRRLLELTALDLLFPVRTTSLS